MATIIDPDGTETEVSPRNGKDFKLIEMYALLKCETIEIVATKDDRIMVIDEERKLNSKPINQKATDLYWFGDNDAIVGKVLVCERTEVL